MSDTFSSQADNHDAQRCYERAVEDAKLDFHRQRADLFIQYNRDLADLQVSYLVAGELTAPEYRAKKAVMIAAHEVRFKALTARYEAALNNLLAQKVEKTP